MNPCDQSLKLSKDDVPSNENEKEAMAKRPFCSLIGSLQYIAQCTRPDVAYAVTHLSRFMENPGNKHWNAAIKILRYLNTTRDRGINYKASPKPHTPIAYSDADWGSNIDDRRSVSGVMIMMNGGSVVYKSKYQRTVALSSAEAEYLAMSLCTQEVIWVRTMMSDIGYQQKAATQVWEDNQGAIVLAHNSGYNARTKHVDIRHHFIREKVIDGAIKIDYVETKNQLADILTKGLATKRFEFLRDRLCIKSHPASSDQQ